MSESGDSFVADEFLRTRRGDVALWSTASVLVLSGLVAGFWAYQTYMPKAEPLGAVGGAMVVEFAEFDTSPITEELDVPEGEASVASEAAPPTELEPEEEIEPIEEPPPPEEEPPPVEEPPSVEEPPPVEEPAPEEVQPEEPPAELEEIAEPEPAVEPEPVPEPVIEEPIIDVPEVEVPEPAVVIPRAAAVFPPMPEPEAEPEPIDPNLPMPVAMPARIAETRAETPPTVFTPPPRRTAPPEQQASSQTSAPRPAAVQAEKAATPQPAPVSAPSTSQVNRWEGSVLRHIGQRRRYPADAKQRGEEGRVVVQFTIDTSGRVLSVRIASSSGFAALDQAARDLVMASSPVPTPPSGLPSSKLTIAIPVDYER